MCNDVFPISFFKHSWAITYVKRYSHSIIMLVFLASLPRWCVKVLALGKCKVLRSAGAQGPRLLSALVVCSPTSIGGLIDSGGNDHPVSRLHPGSVFGGQAVLGISQTRKETVMATCTAQTCNCNCSGVSNAGEQVEQCARRLCKHVS